MTEPADAPAESETLSLIYDGECPLCRNAALHWHLRRAVGHVRLLDAREGRHPELSAIAQAGLKLDDGMAIFYQGRLYHGADAVHLMALLGSRQDWFNRVVARLFRSPRRTALLYPLMRATRNALLRLRGKRPLGY